MMHRKINGLAKCYCGNKMIHWKSQWICTKELKEKAKKEAKE